MMKNIFFLPVVPSLAFLAAALNWDPVRHGKLVYILTYIYISDVPGWQQCICYAVWIGTPIIFIIINFVEFHINYLTGL